MSGDDEGYGDYTAEVFSVQAGLSYSFEAHPNEWIADLPYFVLVWVDWNQDGDFYDENEAILQQKIYPTTLVDITMPNGISEGAYRMRVALSNRKSVSPCGSFEFGEAEDYTLQFGESASRFNYSTPFSSPTPLMTKSITLFPNPATDFVAIDFKDWNISTAQLSIFHINGALVWQNDLNIEQAIVSLNLQAFEMQAGIYFIKIKGDDETQEVLRLVKK